MTWEPPHCLDGLSSDFSYATEKYLTLFREMEKMNSPFFVRRCRPEGGKKAKENKMKNRLQLISQEFGHIFFGKKLRNLEEHSYSL